MLGTAPAAEFVVIDLVAQHDVEPDQQPPGECDLGLGPTTSPEDRDIDALEEGIAAGREGSRLAEHPAQGALPCLLMCPSRYLSAEALTAGANPI